MDTAIASQLGYGALLLAGGAVVGWLLGRRSRGVRALALQAELEQARERLASYQDQVEKHFGQTSELFGDLTRQYSAVWDHLAEGARELCSERSPAIGRGFSERPLLISPSAAEKAKDGETEGAAERSEEPPAADDPESQGPSVP